MIYFVWLKCLVQAFTIKRLSEIITKLKKLSYRCIKRTENVEKRRILPRINCYDNAVIESFFAILKSECFYSRTYHSIAELQAEIEEYLVYYNQNELNLV